jgi:hypothetical protein
MRGRESVKPDGGVKTYGYDIRGGGKRGVGGGGGGGEAGDGERKLERLGRVRWTWPGS